MSALSERSTPQAGPTADTPNIIELGYEDRPLSKVACWREDELYVLRSLEYDVIAADEDLGRAVGKFLQNTIAYAQMLGHAEDATRDDVDLALTIFGRLAEIAAALPQTERPRRRGGLLGRVRRGRGVHGWSLHPAALN